LWMIPAGDNGLVVVPLLRALPHGQRCGVFVRAWSESVTGQSNRLCVGAGPPVGVRM
jgi:hypothetical protein